MRLCVTESTPIAGSRTSAVWKLVELFGQVYSLIWKKGLDRKLCMIENRSRLGLQQMSKKEYAMSRLTAL